MYLHPYTGMILGLHPADERRCYFVKTFLIGWVQTYSQPCYITVDHSSLSSPLCMFFHYTKISSCWRNCNLEMHRTKITSDAVRAKMIFLFQCCNYVYFLHTIRLTTEALLHVNAHNSCFCFNSMKNTPHVGNILLISNHIPSTILLRVAHHPVLRHSGYTHLQMPTCQNKPPGYTTSQNYAYDFRLPWWRHQIEKYPRHWPFARVIHRSPVNSPHKGQWRGALMFSLICAFVVIWQILILLISFGNISLSHWNCKQPGGYE